MYKLKSFWLCLLLLGAWCATRCGAGCPVVIDVRTKSEWDEGHLACAHLLPVQEDASLAEKIECLAGGKSADAILVYCRSGNRAGVAVQFLESKGFTTAKNEGGYTEALSKNLCNCTPQNTCKSPNQNSNSSAPARDAENESSRTPVYSHPIVLWGIACAASLFFIH